MRRKTFWFIPLILLMGCSRQTPSLPTPALETSPEATNAPSPTFTVPAPTTTPAPPTPATTPAVTATVYVPPVSIMGIDVVSMENQAQKDLFQGSGAVWSRHNYFHWDEIEPANVAPDEFKWDTVNVKSLTAASENGAIPIGIVQFTPVWAQKFPGFSCGPIAEEALDDFAEFMGALVSRYSQPPYELKYWEIGNEPDIAVSLVPGNSIYGCWGNNADPNYGGGYYGEMLKSIYPAVKAADPEAKVLVGGLLMDCDPVNPPETAKNSGLLKDCKPSLFLKGILEAGAGDSFDGVSYHAYDYYYGAAGSYGNEGWHSSSQATGPALSAKADYLRSVLEEYGYGEKELLNTEVAVLCGKSGMEPVCTAEDFSNTKAYYIAQAYAAALAEGLDANVWYSLTGWRGSGLVDKNLEPNPAYEAYQFTARELTGAVYQGPVEGFDGVMGYQFSNQGKGVWVVWSLDGEPHKITLPAAYQAVYDVFGSPVDQKSASGKELEITIAPLFVEWID